MGLASNCKMSPSFRPRAVRPASFRSSRGIGSERLPLKSYKHRHRHKMQEADSDEAGARSNYHDCDMPRDASSQVSSRLKQRTRSPKAAGDRQLCMIVRIVLMVAAALAAIQTVAGFCPARCHCNDLDLSANCTQISSISIVPMTLNPLLKRLTLNHLPISELSNSLSIYHQLEVLNLNSNLLARIRYQNFNFKPAPHVISLAPASLHQSAPQQQHQHQQPHSNSETADRAEVSELQARHLRQSFERSELLETSEGEIRHHLRELHLANNRLDQLGDFGAYSEAQQQQQQQSGSSASGSQSKLRAHELEKLAPFLSLSKLELLDLSGNQLVRLHQHAFLGLLRLKHLDLSRNQLEFVDKHALVGLLALETLRLNSNKLGHHQHQLNQLGTVLCRGPLLELTELDLSDNSARGGAHTRQLTKQAHHERLVLPNEMAVCSPKLRHLNLRALNLEHLQVNAFDQLNQLARLDLSENPLEQVPLDALVYSRSNLSSSLRQLDLSDTKIEFIAAGTFVQLRLLEELHMCRMSQLLSFDLASLITAQQQVPQSELKLVNKNLRQLRLSHNRRLQSVHSSLGSPIQFEQLELLDLAHSGELREFQLERVLRFDASAREGQNQEPQQQRAALQVDLSSSNSLNCSACQMGWLVRAARQQASAALPDVVQQHSVQAPPAATSWPPQAVPETSQLGWSPIPFDPFSSNAAAHFAAPPTAPPRPIVPVSARTPPASAPNEPPVELLHLEALNCAWPFSMPLVELIGLETNYAPLFDRGCARQAPAKWRHLQATGLDSNSSAGLVIANGLSTDRKLAPEVKQLSPVVAGAGHDRETNLEGPIWVGAALLVGLLLIVTFKLVHLLVLRHSRPLLEVDQKFSSSFTATTSPGSSSSSSSASSAGPYFKQVAAVWTPNGHTASVSTTPSWPAPGAKSSPIETFHYDRQPRQLQQLQRQQQQQQQQQQQWPQFRPNQSAATTMRPAFHRQLFDGIPNERAQIKEFAWAQEAVERNAGSDGLKQSNLFSRFVGRLSGRGRPSFSAAAAATLAGNNADEWRRRALSNSVQSFGQRQSNKRHENDTDNNSSNNNCGIEHEQQLDYAQLARDHPLKFQLQRQWPAAAAAAAVASRAPDDVHGNQLAIYGNQPSSNEYAICGFDAQQPGELGGGYRSMGMRARSGQIETGQQHSKTAPDYEVVGTMALDTDEARARD